MSRRKEHRTDLKFSVSCTIVLVWDGTISENSVGEEDRVRDALVISSSSYECLDRSIRQSKIDPNRRDCNRGYCAVKIGASCS